MQQPTRQPRAQELPGLLGRRSPTFFELSRWDGKTRAFRVSYDTIGCNLRPILVNPRYTPLDPAVIEQRLRTQARHPQLKGAP